jgi:hypothetical protein
MKTHFDPVVAGRIKRAWGKLAPAQKRMILPVLLKAHAQAVAVSQTKAAPQPDPTVNHNLLLIHSALNDDRDGALSSLEAGVVVDVGPEGQIYGTGKYQQLDPGWAEAGAVWLEHVFTGKHSFPNNPPVIPIDDVVQIGLAGDWGTGDWRGPASPTASTDVGRHLAFLQPDITVHLGDVYYAGTSNEEQHLLVDLWPAGPKGSFTLNSNHEMYSGGSPYFDVALANPKFALQNGSSFFALENNYWVIVGLDSAYYASEAGMYLDGSLGNDGVQVGFLRDQVQKGKKVIVLTHHNGLTDDGSATNTLWDQVMSAFPADAGPALWYWGHIHAGVAYQNHDPQGRNVPCRCCGHGAIPWGQAPVFNNPANVLWYEKRPAHDPDIPERVLNGFAVLYLNGPDVVEVFYDENGGGAWRSQPAN